MPDLPELGTYYDRGSDRRTNKTPVQSVCPTGRCNMLQRSGESEDLVALTGTKSVSDRRLIARWGRLDLM